MRIAVTGSTGLIGSTMARHLGNVHEIVTVGRRPSADLRVDLSDPVAVASMDMGEVDVLVHCAGVVDEDVRDDRERALRMALFGADALVKAAVAAGATRLIYVSSAHVYGPLAGTIDESLPPNPMSDYAIAHFATEQVFRRQVNDEIAGLALRPCAVFGELADMAGFRRWSLIPFSFPKEAVTDHRITIKSTGEQRRNFVGTGDIADCSLNWLNATPAGWTVLNPLGALDATVYEFGQLCAALSEEVAAQPCEVSRVAVGGPTAGQDLDYTSQSTMTRGSQSVSETLLRIMRAIHEEG